MDNSELNCQPNPGSRVLTELLDWSASRPDWQQDALRRIAIAGGITEPDLDELEQLCRATHGVAAAGVRIPVSSPLTSAHIAAGGGAPGDPLSLVAIRNLKHVNRIPADAELTFGPSPGLTVVFGPNGAGKSGYARVLKKACQTRGAPPVIHANAHLPKPAERASAEVVARHGATEFTHHWVDGTPPEPHLAQVFVFDAATADNYLSTDASTSFTPSGLDILPKLSQTCDRLRERIDREQADIEEHCAKTAADWGVPTGTPTGAFLAALSARTKPEAVDAATAFSPEDAKALAELEATLKTDPAQKAKATRASAERIEKFVAKCETRMTHFSQEALARLAAKITSAAEAAKAARAFSDRRFPVGVLPGTGGDLWKKLWDAAREFAESAAYPGIPFPPPVDIAETVRCVLCQQGLSPEIKTRFADFAAFLADQSQKLAAEATAGLAEILTKLKALQPLVEDAKGIEADVGEELATTVNAFAAASDRLLTAVRAQIEHREVVSNAPAVLDVSPLKVLIQQLRERAAREEAALDPAKRQEMQQRLANLQARQTATRRKPDILAHVQALQRLESLKKCLRDTSTQAITTKSTELTEQVVTRAYLSAFTARLGGLGLRTIKVEMAKVGGRKGEAKYGIRLKETHVSHSMVPSGIASEGEQRCIALAAFLAELSQASHQSALVFDDPVCSLDHHFRSRVADVLAEEATRRQVIVFTHDLVFLNDLGRAVKDRVMLTPRSIEWGQNGPGLSRKELPWEGKSVEDRLEKLEKRQRDVARTCTGIPNEDQTREILDIYSRLRGTIERIIEDKVLETAITRFDNEVRVGKLRALVGFSQNEFDRIAALHRRCCGLTPAHDSATARQLPTPSPTDLAKDLQDARDLLACIKSRKSAISNQGED
jgi:energy-coupling factor transporter ATP-binding protein EcfA2